MSRVSGLRRRWWIEGNDVAVFVVPVVVSDALDVAGLGRSPADADADADALPVLALLLPPTAAAAPLNVIAGIADGELLRLRPPAARLVLAPLPACIARATIQRLDRKSQGEQGMRVRCKRKG